MRGVPLVLSAIVAVVSLTGAAIAVHPAHRAAESPQSPGSSGITDVPGGADTERLWIFYADFSDLSGDNAGWSTYDMSETFAQENFWHIDSTFGLSPPTVGDSAWWCGTGNDCWAQARGYGNRWTQELSRDFALSEASEPGDVVTLSFDHRYAMERDYDWGSVDVSTDGGDTWTTLATYTNPGFQGDPGASVPWQSELVSLSDYAGQDILLRFLFQSDETYSSADTPSNPPRNSCKDGAWQLDNIEVAVNAMPYFYDDCEQGDTGWIHEDRPASGQVGQRFWRGQYWYDFMTGRAHSCDDRDEGEWMYAAVDPFTSQLVDFEDAWLVSPPIDISGAPRLTAMWDMWVDCPRGAHDYYDLWINVGDTPECVQDLSAIRDEEEGAWYGGHYWTTETDNWDRFAGNDWLAINWRVWNEEGGQPHQAGVFLNWIGVDVPVGQPGTDIECLPRHRFRDRFDVELAEALLDTGRVRVTDPQGVVEVRLLASDDGGGLWHSYDCRQESPPDGEWWLVPPPAYNMVPGSEIHYYFEAEDSYTNITRYPEDAPDETFEFSILPIGDPDVLLVDKHGGPAQTDDETYGRESQAYYEAVLDLLGYTWNRFDVQDHTSEGDDSDGPVLDGLRYYETIVWFTSNVHWNTVKAGDQENLIAWLSDAEGGDERNLLLTGNNIGYELVDLGRDNHDLYYQWLATDYLTQTEDDLDLELCDAAGGFTFMDHDDGCCDLLAGCPQLPWFDVIDASPDWPGSERVADYVRTDTSTLPAGVAYTHPAMGYQTVNLGFGLEYMAESEAASGRESGGLDDQVNLMRNAMDYFGVNASGSGTGVADGSYRNAISDAYPNPFNPSTTIEYSVKEAGRTTIAIYTAGGRLVRTLLDADLAAGAAGKAVWDGRDDAGEPCGSGIYFFRVDAPGYRSTGKAALLK